MKNPCSQRVLPLDGVWGLVKDPDNMGKARNWHQAYPLGQAREAPVPGIVQQVFHDFHGVSWYRRAFTLESIEKGLRYFLHFDAVDYYADVYVNGLPAGSHEGEEIPFDVEITGLVRWDADNELVVRIINPVDDVLYDGLNFLDIPRSNHAVRGYSPGGGLNQGGITRSVRLIARPEVYIADVFARANPHTGVIEMDVELENPGEARTVRLEALAAGMDCPVSSLRTSGAVTAGKGRTLHTLSLSVANHRLWDVDDPYLYNLDLSVGPEDGGRGDEDRFHLRVGFRELRVEDGFFYLNDRRIFLKSSHTGNHVPIGNSWPVDPDLLRRDLILMKSVGFNCIRFISCNAIPAQLDFCDELGFLVYEESRASWMLNPESPRMAEHYDRSTGQTIRRDRNHPCVGVWGLLNETYDNAVYRHARDYLPTLRKLDDTRLVLLASGRWDLELSTGSIANPGSDKWEYQWGDERPDHPGLNVKDVSTWIQEIPLTPWLPGTGDAHSYPKLPFNDETVNGFLRRGEDHKPFLLSETGAGSQYNSPGELRRFEQAGAPELLPDRLFIKSMADRYEVDFRRYGLEDVYPFAEDFYFDTQRHQTRNRKFIFNLVRANPQICGYNVTGLLDHAMAGEGLWSFWREFKPGAMDMLEGGFAKLRFCLFVRPYHGYTDKPFRVFVAVANEDELRPGSYSVTMRIHGNGKTVWEKRADLVIPESVPGKPAPLAYTLHDAEVTLPAGCRAGTYTLSADIAGAHARERQVEFVVAEAARLPKLDAEIIGVGLDAASVSLLQNLGVKVKTMETRGACDRALVSAMPKDDKAWAALLQLVRDGGHVAFMNTGVFADTAELKKRLDFVGDGFIKFSDDWLYHKDNVIKPGTLAEGLDGPGVMDLSYYGNAWGRHVYENMPAPDRSMVVAFATCYPIPSGYTSYVVTGSYRYGKGTVTLNGLDICQNVGHPAADRLLINMAKYVTEN